jgi:probable blue pigment (indigoidine) exporter
MLDHAVHPRALMLIAAAGCWGVGTVVTKQVLDHFPALTLLLVQLLASTVFLLGVQQATRSRVTWSPQLRRLTVLGLLNPGLAYALGIVGLASITASLSVLLWTLEPVLILLLAALLLRERVSGLMLSAMATAIGGVLLIVYQSGPAGEPIGVVLTVVAVGACAIYTVAARALLLHDASVTVALVQQAAALVLAVGLVLGTALFGGDVWPSEALPVSAWTTAAVSGVLYYGLAFWLYLGALSRIPASVAGAFLPLIPVFGVAAGYLIGERLVERQWLGAAVVVAAVTVIALLQRRRTTGPHPERSDDAFR